MSRFQERTGGAHALSTLTRARTSSPRAEDYTTASSFDLQQEPQSTLQLENAYTQPEPSDHGESNDEGSEPSIELGRGVKRGSRNASAELSPHAIFSLGNDSQYEITGTPPMRPRTTSRKSEGTLRKEASIRRATETVQRSTSAPKHRTLSEAFKNIHQDPDSTFIERDHQNTVTVNTRNTRFRNPSTNGIPTSFVPGQGLSNAPQQHTPQHAARHNITVHSATYTGNQTQGSFALPDLPDISELVSGYSKMGAPVISRNGTARTRFTSDSYRPASGGKPAYARVEGIKIPGEEKAIFAALALLKDKVSQLEQDKSEAQKRAEEYESEIIELRSQVQIEQRLRRSDSALGSDSEGSGHGKWRIEKTKLQSSVKALQDRLDRSERKISLTDIAVKRVTKERDELVSQIGMAYYNVEELKAENEEFREEHGKMVAENEDLNEECAELRQENSQLRLQLARLQAQQSGETAQWARRETELKEHARLREEMMKKMKDLSKDPRNAKEPLTRSKMESRASLPELTELENVKRRSSGHLGQQTRNHMSDQIEEALQWSREEAAAAKVQSGHHEQVDSQRKSSSHVRSMSRSRRQNARVDRPQTTSRRAFSAPVESDVSDADSTTEREITQRTRQTLRDMALPASNTHADYGKDRDITLISVQHPDDIAKLRKKLEEEHIAKMHPRTSSAPLPKERENTARSLELDKRHRLARKSSLKAATAGLDDGTGRFSFHPDDEGTKAAKAVRIQSPHTSDATIESHQQAQEEGETSMLSNTSRRRHRVPSQEGMTSAFIIPDITLHNGQALPIGGIDFTIQHKKTECTACPPGKKDVNIPTPTPVTDRDAPDVTDATIRPAQAPSFALAAVLKQLEDEIVHLKLRLQHQENLYAQHDPALSKTRRQRVRANIDVLLKDIEKRSDQVYALYDVLEGQKEAAAAAGQAEKDMDQEEVEETLMSIGLDPREIERMRSAPAGLDGALSDAESEALPWEGISELSSEEGDR